MGADFYPRLTAVSKDNPECCRLVNEQAQISLLLAGPGVIATLSFATLVLALFYSVEFQAAVGLLRWILPRHDPTNSGVAVGLYRGRKGCSTAFFVD